ncbi:MAG: DUF4097 family beta strand repeat protein [Deltaproteobacteria bacterium]|nr:DUF4097 family beta strand repeat protein [Deltaproteobacteria bacterium]
MCNPEKIERAACLTAIAMLLAAGPAAAGAVKTIEAPKGATVVIETRSGQVELSGWARDEVKVESSADDVRVLVEGQVVRIGIGMKEWAGKLKAEQAEQAEKAEQGEQGDESGSAAAAGDLRVQVPKGASVRVSTLSGDIAVEGLEGRCELKSVSGEVKIASCSGPVKAKSVSGDVTLRALRGGLEASSVSGDVRGEDIRADSLETKSVSGGVELAGVHAGRVRLKSHSGDVHYRGELGADGGLEAKSFSGDIAIELPSGAGFELSAQSRSGSVLVGFPLQAEERSEHRARGRAGAGGAELELATFSGDISVRSSK